MVNSVKTILVLEPYYGGSHKSFLNSLERELGFDFIYLTLPARKWKWRMGYSALWFAEKICKNKNCDLILCSTFVDVAAFLGLAPAWVRSVPVYTYFHENQFAYPNQIHDKRDAHYPLINFTSGLASDGLAFNSKYNLSTYLAGCRRLEKMAPDMRHDFSSKISAKAIVLSLPFDYAAIDTAKQIGEQSSVPLIIWNHRWEHDKCPELFFETLFSLAENGISFQLCVLGQSFIRNPPIFAEAKERLKEQIVNFGFVDSREEYIQWLKKGTLVVSTASHEFFGMAIMEAVRAGCRPFLPNDLSYPELFGAEYLYERDNFKRDLSLLLQEKVSRLENQIAMEITEPYSWNNMVDHYRQWFFPY